MIFTIFVAATLSAAQAPAGHTGGHGAESTTIRGSGAGLQNLPEQNQNLPQTRTNANGERLICRRIEATASRTGSRRVCLTAREWREHQN